MAPSFDLDGYDAVNNLTVATDTINGMLSGVKLNSYDALNRVTQMTQSGAGVAEKRIDLAYDAASQMTSLTRYSDLAGTQLVATSNYRFDDNGRLTDLTHQRGSTVLANYGFVYDAVNRITQMTSADGVSDYNYDLTNQLTGADYNYQTDEAYSYDANGNRTNAGYGTGSYNQLLTDGVYTYEYDAEGNRTKRTEIATGEVTEYLWDYRNRLTAVTTKTATGVVSRQVSYSYDVNNQRIAKVVDLDGSGAAAPTTERFVYDGDHIALTFDGAETLTERFFHGPTIDQVIAQEGPGGLVTWALADHLGSVRDVIDSNGAILNHLVYDSFGQIKSETNSAVDFRFSYTGREFDGETEQYYYRARYYDASIGEFISTDPIGFLGEDLNLYRYVSNAPSYLIDPEGYRVSPPQRDVRRPPNNGTGAPSSPGSLPYRPNSPGPGFDPSRQLAPPDWTQNIPRLPEWTPPLSPAEAVRRMREAGNIPEPSVFPTPLLQDKPKVDNPNQCKQCKLTTEPRKPATNWKSNAQWAKDGRRHVFYSMFLSKSNYDVDYRLIPPGEPGISYDAYVYGTREVMEVKAPRDDGGYWFGFAKQRDMNPKSRGGLAIADLRRQVEEQARVADLCGYTYKLMTAGSAQKRFFDKEFSGLGKTFKGFSTGYRTYPRHMLTSYFGL